MRVVTFCIIFLKLNSSDEILFNAENTLARFKQFQTLFDSVPYSEMILLAVVIDTFLAVFKKIFSIFYDMYVKKGSNKCTQWWELILQCAWNSEGTRAFVED